MGTMNINVYGRDYAIACDDGQEAHLGKLTQMVNDRVKQLSQQMGRAPEHTMLIYTALMLCDELLDMRKEAARLQAATENMALPVDESRLHEMEAAMASSMQQIAARIEKLALKLEKAA